MIDIWGEKPHYYNCGPWHISQGTLIYRKDDMDLWLERLKAEYDVFREKAENYDRVVQTYEGMIEVRELVIYKHLEKIKAIEKFIRSKADSSEPAYAICVGVLSIIEGEKEGEIDG